MAAKPVCGMPCLSTALITYHDACAAAVGPDAPLPVAPYVQSQCALKIKIQLACPLDRRAAARPGPFARAILKLRSAPQGVAMRHDERYWHVCSPPLARQQMKVLLDCVYANNGLHRMLYPCGKCLL